MGAIKQRMIEQANCYTWNNTDRPSWMADLAMVRNEMTTELAKLDVDKLQSAGTWLAQLLAAVVSEAAGRIRADSDSDLPFDGENCFLPAEYVSHEERDERAWKEQGVCPHCHSTICARMEGSNMVCSFKNQIIAPIKG